MPSLATAFILDQDFNERAFAKRLLLLTALGILGYYFLLWSGRISVEIGVRASLAALNPIALGHLAATAIIAAIYHVTSRPTLLALLGAGTVGALAIPALFAAGSCGPLVALTAAVIWMSITNKRRALVMIPALVIGTFFIPTDNLAVERLLGVFNSLDRSSLALLELQRSALADFLDYPFHSRHFMDASFGQGTWPHNYFLEAAMALEFWGLLLATAIVVTAFKAAISSINSTNPLLVTLLVQSLVAVQFSGAIWASDRLFILFAAVLALGRLNRRRRSTPRHARGEAGGMGARVSA